MTQHTTPTGESRAREMAYEDAIRALYIDFEGLGRRAAQGGRRESPAPVLIGIQARGRGWRMGGVQQWALQPAFSGLADREARLTDVVDHLVRRAEHGDRRIVAWSDYELEVVRRFVPDLDLVARFERRYVNAKLVVRRWWNATRRDAGPAPRTLSEYLALDPDAPSDPAAGAVAATIDDIARTVEAGRRLSTRQRDHWARVRDHNRRDCVGTRRLCMTAASGLAAHRGVA